MGKSKLSTGAIIGFTGACIAFYIGAGFATMQEIMQYEASYGSQFWIVIAVAVIIYLYTNLSFATNGSRLGLERGGDIYTHYTGKYIGTFFDYFSAFFCYMCFIVMCGGANATATQQWGVPSGVGSVVLTIAVVATSLFGLSGILNTLGKLGPVIIALILIVSTITAITGIPDFGANLALIDSSALELTQVGGGNPFASGASYGGFVILWFAAFLAETGAKNKLKEVNIGMILSALFIFGAAAICCIALIGHIGETGSADIPALVLANSINPLFAQAFSLIIFAAIYTTAVPLLWTGVGRVAKEGTSKYSILTVVGGVVGMVAAMFLPYKILVNVLYGLNGYLGFILIGFMLVYDIRTKMSSNIPANVAK